MILVVAMSDKMQFTLNIVIKYIKKTEYSPRARRADAPEPTSVSNSWCKHQLQKHHLNFLKCVQGINAANVP